MKIAIVGYGQMGHMIHSCAEAAGHQVVITADPMAKDASFTFTAGDSASLAAAIKESGLLDLRLPLVTSYSAKNENALPPQVAHEQNPGGREKSETVTSDGNEADVDGAN